LFLNSKVRMSLTVDNKLSKGWSIVIDDKWRGNLHDIFDEIL
jgi:hypothetical protein